MVKPLFSQSPPELGNQYLQDRVLQSFLKRHLTPASQAHFTSELHQMGELAGGKLFDQQMAELSDEPILHQFDAWGNRIDHIQVTELWQTAARIAAEFGLVGKGYDSAFGTDGRLAQMALVYLFHPSTDVYSCPLAMSDGAAQVLLNHPSSWSSQAFQHLTSTDSNAAWTSGQWMTETPGGSDVSASQTTANKTENGHWHLNGRKWFSSATTAQMAITLARPEGNPAGSRGLALFALETKLPDGSANGIEVLRLKDKLGTKKLPTAELHLNNCQARLLSDTSHGVKAIAPMLNITRTWNAVCSVASMRRAIALARDYANRRVAFGKTLAEQPLHQTTLANMQAEFEAAFHLTFYQVGLLGKSATQSASAEELLLLRLLTPIAKLYTGKVAVTIASEALECFGGAGYVENTGIPKLLRDAQVFPIWEGTTNVLALDTLRVLGDANVADSYFAQLKHLVNGLEHAQSIQLGEQISQSAKRLRAALDASDIEYQGRSIAISLGRLMAAALLTNHADWSLPADPRPLAAAKQFASTGLIHIDCGCPSDAEMLATDIFA